ncbi:hypothetical protein Tco_0715713, partial [Tanacetum coccineum]
MSTLKFADTHNMVAFLAKPTESKGFEQIVDFLNAHPINYALNVNPTIYTSCIEQFWSTVKAKMVNGEPSGATTNVADEVVFEEMDDSLERAATTTTSLDAEPDRRVNTPQSDEYSLKLKELMELCTNLQNRVIDLEKSKTSQAQEITSLKRRVKRLEKKGGSRTHKLKRLYKVGLSARVESFEDEGLGEEDASKQGRIDDIDANEDIYLVNVHRDEDMFEVNDLEGDEVIVETKVDHEVVVETEVAYKDVNLSVDEVTLAQALAALKSAKPKADKVMLQEPEHGTITTTAATTVTAASTRPNAKGLVIHEEEQATTQTVSSQQPSQVKVQDKGKGIMVEEPLKMKKKDQISFDKQEAIRLQAEFDEDERLAREKMKPILQAQEQEELTDEEAKRVEEKRNRPPTRAQQRSIMCTYLKNMKGWKPKSLTNKSFANIQELFGKAFKRVNTFVDYRTELMEESSKKEKVMEESSKKVEAKIAQESSSKRAGEALEQE